jgi:CheY-like chemotaxis protein
MKTILVVDDEFGVAEVLEALLTDEGYRVTTAVNGRQGLTRLSEVRPDLVLLDVMMPIVDGPAMLRAMQEDPILRAIPVVMMSSLGEDVVRTQCQGYAAFLRKPFRATAVLDTVARILGDGAETSLD